MCCAADVLICRPITRYPGGPVDEPVNAAAKRLGATPTQVILSWVRSKGVVIVTYVLGSAKLYNRNDCTDMRAQDEFHQGTHGGVLGSG